MLVISEGHIPLPSEASPICLKTFFRQVTRKCLRKRVPFSNVCKDPIEASSHSGFCHGSPGSREVEKKRTTSQGQLRLGEEGKRELLCFAPVVTYEIIVWWVYSLEIKLSLELREIKNNSYLKRGVLFSHMEDRKWAVRVNTVTPGGQQRLTSPNQHPCQLGTRAFTTPDTYHSGLPYPQPFIHVFSSQRHPWERRVIPILIPHLKKGEPRWLRDSGFI